MSDFDETAAKMKCNLPLRSDRGTMNLWLQDTLVDAGLKGKPWIVLKSIRPALESVLMTSASHLSQVKAQVMVFEWGQS